jgi:nitroreductase
MEIRTEKMKSATIEYPVLDEIRNRRSIRAFATKEVEEEKVKSLLEAARWAPSSANEQPWEYIYVHRRQTDPWNKFFEPLNEGNRIWVQSAPLLIFSYARKNFVKNNKPNAFAKYDLGAANAFIALQATALGLQVHQMGGYSAEKIIENLQLPQDIELGTMMAIGYPGTADDLPETLKMRELAPRERFNQEQFTHHKTR